MSVHTAPAPAWECPAADLAALECERLLNCLVVPRPIAWVGSVDRHGVRNLAPFSYFTVASRNPPIVMLSFGGDKDTLRNASETGGFIINVVSAPLADAMVASSAAHPPEVDEFALLGLASVPGTTVAAPRLVQALAAMECTVHAIQPIGDSTLLFGQVRHFHVAEQALREGRVSAEALAAVGRLGGAEYCTADRPYRIDKPA